MMVSTGGPLYHFRRICLIEMSEMDVIVKWYELKCVFFPFDTWAHWTLHYNKSSDICANIWQIYANRTKLNVDVDCARHCTTRQLILECLLWICESCELVCFVSPVACWNVSDISIGKSSSSLVNQCTWSTWTFPQIYVFSLCKLQVFKSRHVIVSRGVTITIILAAVPSAGATRPTSIAIVRTGVALH